MAARDAVELLGEVAWEQKTYGIAVAAAGSTAVLPCDFLTHPVGDSASGIKGNNAGASTATPSVFSPCPSEAASPVLEASCCFSPDASNPDNVIASEWETASTTRQSSCSIQNSSNGGVETFKKKSSGNGGSTTIDAEEASMRSPRVSGSFICFLSGAAASQQHLSASSRASTAAEPADCHWEEDNGVASGTQAGPQKWWQPSSLLFGHHSGTAASAAFAPQLPDCNSSISPWRRPAPLEGGRTAATRDYYVGDETCMVPAAAASSSAVAPVSLLLPQLVVEPQQIEEERMAEQQNVRQQVLLEKTKHTERQEEEWETIPPAEQKRNDQNVQESLEIRTAEEEDEEDGEKGGPPLLLFPFLRKAKVLKIAINEVLLLQQQTGYLMMLQPPSSPTAVPAAFCSSCNGGSSALERTLLMESSGEQVLEVTAPGEKSSKKVSLCYHCELALHVNTAQQLLTRSHRVLQQMQAQQEEEEIRWQQEQQLQQQQHSSSMTLFLEQMHQQQNTAASAAELRIRRSVLRQQHQQLQVALEQQQQLEDDLRARWETEVLADMQTLCPDRPQQELQQRLAQQLLATEEQQGSAAAAWLLVESSTSTRTDVSAAEAADAEPSVSTLATTTAGGDLQAAEVLAVKCRQLQKLQARLLEVRSMMEQMQQQQLGKDDQIGCVEEAVVLTKQNTTDAVQDLLLARKYQRRAFRHSLYFIGALAALFLFFFFPASPLVPLLFLFHGERLPPHSP